MALLWKEVDEHYIFASHANDHTYLYARIWLVVDFAYISYIANRKMAFFCETIRSESRLDLIKWLNTLT